MKSVLVVAGETSGEQHAAGLIRQTAHQAPGAFQWFGAGGKEMQSLGVELLADVSQLAAIGPRAALSNASAYWKLFQQLQDEVKARKVDTALLVDFPEFNLRLARRLKRLGTRICYFISPQIWAWRPARVKIVRDYVDLMLVIFPFEVEFYRRHGVDVHYVGNPLRQLGSSSERRTGELSRVVLFPGSRRKEADVIYPIQLEAMSQVVRSNPCRVEVGVAPAIQVEHLQKIESEWRANARLDLQVDYRSGDPLTLLQGADCAIIKSGTSTLQAMVLSVPFCMVYRMSELSYRLLRPLVRTDTYCLANLVAGHKVVPEFVQHGARPELIANFVERVLRDSDFRSNLKLNLRNASERLGNLNAYEEAARRFVTFVQG